MLIIRSYNILYNDHTVGLCYILDTFSLALVVSRLQLLTTCMRGFVVCVNVETKLLMHNI